MKNIFRTTNTKMEPQAVQLSLLTEGKIFITQHIDDKIGEQVSQHPKPRLILIWALLYWMYLETFGRWFQPAKYHLYLLAKKQIEKKRAQDTQ